MNRNIDKAREIAKKRGIENYDTLSISNRENKRFKILSPNNKIIHFGLYPFKNGTFIDHNNETIKKNWKARHIKILKDGKPAYLNRESPEYYSWNILW
jgi:hypothetical protein